MTTNSLFNHNLSPVLGAVLFLAFVLVGAAYIVWAKLVGAPAVQVTSIPLGLMVLYALALGSARYLRLRDDQAGDNLYYLGFLYTLTSLGVSLWQFSVHEGAHGIVVNFGVAIATTILGVALRVVFNQMRQDPVEVERTARLELADAARRVKRELNDTTLEIASFRRTTQQMSQEALSETRTHTERVTNLIAEPLKAAAEQSKDTLDKLAMALISRLEGAGNEITTQQERLASTTNGITSSLEDIDRRLRAIQMPDGIIEIKLQPVISGLTKAINNHSKATADQIAELQKSLGQFDKTVRELAEYVGHSKAAADQLANLQKTLNQSDKTVQELAGHVSEAARVRTDDQRLLRELLSKVDDGAAESRRLLTELDKKVAATSGPRPSERPEPVWGAWLRGRAS